MRAACSTYGIARAPGADSSAERTEAPTAGQGPGARSIPHSRRRSGPARRGTAAAPDPARNPLDGQNGSSARSSPAGARVRWSDAERHLRDRRPLWEGPRARCDQPLRDRLVGPSPPSKPRGCVPKRIFMTPLAFAAPSASPRFYAVDADDPGANARTAFLTRAMRQAMHRSRRRQRRRRKVLASPSASSVSRGLTRRDLASRGHRPGTSRAVREGME